MPDRTRPGQSGSRAAGEHRLGQMDGLAIEMPPPRSEEKVGKESLQLLRSTVVVDDELSVNLSDPIQCIQNPCQRLATYRKPLFPFGNTSATVGRSIKGLLRAGDCLIADIASRALTMGNYSELLSLRIIDPLGTR
jgi:hypothetical protein